MDWEGYEIGHVASGMVIFIKNRTKFKFYCFDSTKACINPFKIFLEIKAKIQKLLNQNKYLFSYYLAILFVFFKTTQ